MFSLEKLASQLGMNIEPSHSLDEVFFCSNNATLRIHSRVDDKITISAISPPLTDNSRLTHGNAINVSITKAFSKIVADIEKRILPQALEVHARYVLLLKKEQQHKQMFSELVDQFMSAKNRHIQFETNYNFMREHLELSVCTADIKPQFIVKTRSLSSFDLKIETRNLKPFVEIIDTYGRNCDIKGGNGLFSLRYTYLTDTSLISRLLHTFIEQNNGIKVPPTTQLSIDKAHELIEWGALFSNYDVALAGGGIFGKSKKDIDQAKSFISKEHDNSPLHLVFALPNGETEALEISHYNDQWFAVDHGMGGRISTQSGSLCRLLENLRASSTDEYLPPEPEFNI
ncbi:hypothetical protein [Photobacterium leiognathi]|uniref:hypothetical protein n=1 Tax=Photobacterium leiognathi TaxID=553611 RepID=UPI002982135C|nr:hypothetical protein [Photobacterium leiognathi]